MNEKKVFWLLKYGVYILFAIGIVGTSISEALGKASGATIFVIIGAFIAIYCGNKNAEWASKINRSLNLAFLVGTVFGLVGLLAYWILYRARLKYPSPESNGGKVVVSILLVLGILFGLMTWEISTYEPLKHFEYEEHIEFPSLTPIPQSSLPAIAKFSTARYGFDFDYPIDMKNIESEGIFSDDADKQSGIFYITNKKDTKTITLTWYETTEPQSLEILLEEGLQTVYDYYGSEGIKISDEFLGPVIETNILGNRMIYQTNDYRIDGIKVYSIFSYWYDEKTQRMFYFGVDAYKQETGEEIFNQVKDSFVSF